MSASPLVLSEDQRIIRDVAARFFLAEAPPAIARARRDAGEPACVPELWRQMGELGLAGILAPESCGGGDMGYVAAGQVMDAIGHQLSVCPFVSTAVMAATILRLGDPESPELVRIATGETTIAFAVDEGARHAPFEPQCVAEQTSDGWTLKGRKTAVADGDAAEVFIVAARVGNAPGPGGIGLFFVAADSPGVDLTRLKSLDGRGVVDLALDRVRVSAADRLDAPGQGGLVLQKALDAGRAMLAAELVGLASRCFDMTLDHLRQREQFGVRIGSFQALQHRVAELYGELEFARSAVLTALIGLDADSPERELFVAVAKAKAGRVAQRVGNEAMQMHGGIAMTDEFDLGLYLKRIWAARAALGDETYHARQVGRLLGYGAAT